MTEATAAHTTIEKPAHITGAVTQYSLDDIAWIAGQFEISPEIEVSPFPGRGNINLHTYEVRTPNGEYLLQKVNSEVFTMPHRVMNSMISSIQAQAEAMAQGKGVSDWEPIQLIPTIAGSPYLDLTDAHGWNVWRLMVRISDSTCFKSLGEVRGREAQLELAEEVGRGMAIYADLTSSIDPSQVEGSLPGYRDTALYFAQFHSVMRGNRRLEQVGDSLPADPIVRASTERFFLVELDPTAYGIRKEDPEISPFIELVQQQEPFGMGLWSAVDSGEIRRTLIHGDTKIENFLFSTSSGRVKSLVDLDTIMPFTWLADWGDGIRSLVNLAGEKERDLSKVNVDRETYEAVAKGFLKAAKEVTDAEVSMMIFAVQAIALELGLRFLTDYLRGDTYFRLGPEDPSDLNKVRAMVQLTLFLRLREFEEEAKQRLSKYRSV